MCDIIPQAEFLTYKMDEKNRCLAVNPGKLPRTWGEFSGPEVMATMASSFHPGSSASPWPWKYGRLVPRGAVFSFGSLLLTQTVVGEFYLGGDMFGVDDLRLCY